MTIEPAPRNGASKYFVLSANAFVGEDAAATIRAHAPAAQIALFDHVDQLEIGLKDAREPVTVLAISPKWSLASRPLAGLIGDRNGALLVLSSEPTPEPIDGCRVLTAHLPFTERSLLELLREADGRD